MCEDRQIGKLTGYGFIGFQKEVEHILQFKAQHSDPLRTPNYYRVLYSWHIVRGDYRNGELQNTSGDLVLKPRSWSDNVPPGEAFGRVYEKWPFFSRYHHVASAKLPRGDQHVDTLRSRPRLGFAANPQRRPSQGMSGLNGSSADSA